jgi:FMN phosphatase YigB (HAD superfamily)
MIQSYFLPKGKNTMHFIKQYSTCFFVSLSLVTLSLCAPIYEIKHIDQVLNYVQNKNDLVVFDLDNTLIRANTLEANSEWFDWHFAQLKSHGYTTDEILKQIEPIHNAAQQKAITRPIEPDTDRIINALQVKGLHPIALTARGSVDLTEKQLKKTRIDFKKNAPDKNICYVFNNLAQPAFYIPGILLAGGNDKGLVLKDFLKHLKSKPKTIIFVDDRLDNIQHVEKTAQQLKIPFIGLRYGYLDPEVDLFKTNMEQKNNFLIKATS